MARWAVPQTTTGLPQHPDLNAQREAAERDLESIAVIERKLLIRMQDGVRLATDVYRPKNAQGAVPTIFFRTPYNADHWDTQIRAPGDMSEIYRWVSRGYAYVLQTERGKYFSEGNWDILGAPRSDGPDAFAWVSAQPWSNGKIGTLGCSSHGEWQMGVADMGSPSLAAMVPQGYGAGIGRMGPFYEQGTWYRGGAFIMEMALFMYEVQNTQRPLFPADTPQADLARLATYYDLEARLPHIDWDTQVLHLPIKDLLSNVNGPHGAFADATPVATGGRMIERTPDDPAWYRGGLYHDTMHVNVPALWMASWYDLSVGPNIELFNQVVRTGTPASSANQRLIIAPVLHCKYASATAHTIVGERDVGDARLAYDHIIEAWFDHFLKGDDNGIVASLPRVTYYTMGSNRWQSSDRWPPKDAGKKTLYLASRGRANTLDGDGRISSQPALADSPDEFVYDPMNPVPTIGGHFCCMRSDLKAGAYDQRSIEARPDVLVYTSDALAEGLEASGPIEVDLFVSSDRRDTDFTAKLVDVYPDGRAYNLDDTIQRVRYREGYDRKVWMQPGKVYRVRLGPMVTSNYFAPGHKIRLEVSSSSFPAFERNLNTGGNNYDEKDAAIARNVVHHSRRYPSSITLMTISTNNK